MDNRPLEEAVRLRLDDAVLRGGPVTMTHQLASEIAARLREDRNEISRLSARTDAAHQRLEYAEKERDAAEVWEKRYREVVRLAYEDDTADFDGVVTISQLADIETRHPLLSVEEER